MNYSAQFSIYPPPSEIKIIVNLIRKLIDLVYNSIEPKYPWNEPRMKSMLDEIVHLVAYQIEQIEGVLCLAETNLYHYPSAFVISRTVLEINVVLEWLLNPEEESERVLRYISYLKGQLCKMNVYEEYISTSSLPQEIKNELLGNKDKVNKDIDEMTQAAKNHGISSEKISKVNGLPNINDMLKEISPEERKPRLKIAYYILSKFSHGMRQSVYRYFDQNIDIENYEPVSDWQYPLYICYESIIASTQKLLRRFEDNPEKFNINLKPIEEMFNNEMNKVFH